MLQQPIHGPWQHYQYFWQKSAVQSCPICNFFLQLFEENTRLLPSLNAIARIRPAAGDGVLRSMLLSQGYPDDDAKITEYRNNAQDKCYEFVGGVSFKSCCLVQ